MHVQSQASKEHIWLRIVHTGIKKNNNKHMHAVLHSRLQINEFHTVQLKKDVENDEKEGSSLVVTQ